MIDAAAVAAVFSAIGGCWAWGFVMGKSVAWVRKLVSIA